MSQTPFRTPDSYGPTPHKIPIWDSSDPYRNPPSLPPAPKSPILNTVGSLIQSGQLGTPTKSSLNGKSTAQLTASIAENINGLQYLVSSLQSLSMESKDSLGKIDDEFRALNKRSVDNYASLSKLSEYIKNSESYSRKILSTLDTGIDRVIDKVELYREGHHNSSIVLDGLLDNSQQVDEKLRSLEKNVIGRLLELSETLGRDMQVDYSDVLAKIQQDVSKYSGDHASSNNELENKLSKTIISIPSKITPLLDNALGTQADIIKSFLIDTVVELKNTILQEIVILEKSLATTHDSLLKSMNDPPAYVKSISSSVLSAIKDNSAQLATEVESIIVNDRVKLSNEIIQQLGEVLENSKSKNDEHLKSIQELSRKVENMEANAKTLDEIKFKQDEVNSHIFHIRNSIEQPAHLIELTELIKLDMVEQLKLISKNIDEMKFEDTISNSFTGVKSLIKSSFEKLTESMSDKFSALVEFHQQLAEIPNAITNIKLETEKIGQELNSQIKSTDTLEELKRMLDSLDIDGSLSQHNEILKSSYDRIHTSLSELLESKLAAHEKRTDEEIKQVFDAASTDIKGSVKRITDAFKQDDEIKIVVKEVKEDVNTKIDNIFSAFIARDQNEKEMLGVIKSEIVNLNVSIAEVKAESEKKLQLLVSSHESALKTSNDKVDGLEKKLVEMEIKLKDSLEKEESQKIELESYKQEQDAYTKHAQAHKTALEEMEKKAAQSIREISDKHVFTTTKFKSEVQISNTQIKELQSRLQESDEKLAQQNAIIQEMESNKIFSEMMNIHMTQLQANMETILKQKMESQLDAVELGKSLSDAVRSKIENETKVEQLTSQLEDTQKHGAKMEEQITELKLAIKAETLEHDVVNIERRKAIYEEDVRNLESKKQVLQVELNELVNTLTIRVAEFEMMEKRLEVFERRLQEALLERSKEILGATTAAIVNSSSHKENGSSSSLFFSQGLSSDKTLDCRTPLSSLNENSNGSGFSPERDDGLIISKRSNLEFGIPSKKQRSISLHKPNSSPNSGF